MVRRFVCDSCDSKIPAQSFCPRCGAPTSLATGQERILWEMGQMEDRRVRVVPDRAPRIMLGASEPAVTKRIQEARQGRAAAAANAIPSFIEGSAAVAVPLEDLDLKPPRAGGTGGSPPSPRPPSDRPMSRSAPPAAPPAPRSSPNTPVETPVEHRAEAPRRRPVVPPSAVQRAQQRAPIARDTTTERPQEAEPVARREQTPVAPTPQRPVERPAPPKPPAERAATPAAPPSPRTPRPPVPRPASPRPPLARTDRERHQPPVTRRAAPEASRPATRPASTRAAVAHAAAAEEAPQAETTAPAPSRAEPVIDDRTLVIKRRTPTAFEEPPPDPVETATVLREISSRPIKLSRKERRARRKAEQAAAKQALKAAKRSSKKRARNRGDDPSKEANEPAVDLIEPEAPELRKLTWKERKAERLLDIIGAVEGETMTLVVDGRARLRAATLCITNYRVALVTRGARRRTIGWIPLEETERIKTVWRGAETMHVEGSFERLSFQASASGALEEAVALIRSEVKRARAGEPSLHSPDVIQLWCERTSEIWENDANRIRLWIRKHPLFTVTWLGSMIPIAYLGAQRL